MAYNFVYSLGQHSYDADCNLFLRIFTGDVEEAVRHEQQALEGEILKMLTLLDVSVNRQVRLTTAAAGNEVGLRTTLLLRFLLNAPVHKSIKCR
jgi:hypothetical protein